MGQPPNAFHRPSLSQLLDRSGQLLRLTKEHHGRAQWTIYYIAVIALALALLSKRSEVHAPIKLDGESFHDSHSQKLSDAPLDVRLGEETHFLPKLPEAWSADVIWSPINHGHLIPGHIDITKSLVRFTFEFPSSGAYREPLELWQSDNYLRGDLLSFGSNKTHVFNCPRVWSQPTPAIVRDKEGIEFGGVKQLRDPWTQRLKNIKMWRAKGSSKAKSGNLFEFYKDSDLPYRFDFVEEDHTWCLSQVFSSIHFRNFQELSNFETTVLKESFEDKVENHMIRKIDTNLRQEFSPYEVSIDTNVLHQSSGLEFLSEEETANTVVPAWPDHLYMEGGFTSNAGKLFQTKVHYSWPHKRIFTQLEHKTLGHTILQTSNTTYIRFGPGKCFVLHGLGLPLPNWSTTTCKVRARFQNVYMAVCSFAPGRDLHYWYMPTPQSEIGYLPIQFLESRAPFREGASLAVADYTQARILKDFTPETLFQIPLDCLQEDLIEGTEDVFDVLSKDHADYMMRGHHSSRHED